MSNGTSSGMGDGVGNGAGSSAGSGVGSAASGGASGPVRKVDVAVIGAGTIGSMALWQLTRQRKADGSKPTVLGIEQYGAAHANGAYAGESRLFRVAVKEGDLFVPALQAARSLWLALGRLTGRQLLVPAGALHIAPGDHPDLAATRVAIEKYGLPHRELGPAELRREFPQFTVRDDDRGIFDELAGALRPENAVFAASRAALAGGAEIWYNTEVLGVDAGAGGVVDAGAPVVIETSAGVVHADKVIVTTGPWATTLMPELADLITIARFALTWFVPEDIDMFSAAKFPGFMRDLDGVHAFGTPTFDGYSVKVSADAALPPVGHPADAHAPMDRETLLELGAKAQMLVPSLDPEPVRWSTHPEGVTVNKRPIIDTVADGRIVLAVGMSGNGFKFAPIWGQTVAELALTGSSRWCDEEYTLAHHRAVARDAGGAGDAVQSGAAGSPAPALQQADAQELVEA